MKPTGSFNIAGVNVATYNAGLQRADLALLFVHGNSSSMHTFERQVSAFGHLALLGFDLPGHGASGNAGTVELYSLRFYADVLKHMISTVRSKRVLLVGWSLGGHVVLEVLSELTITASAVLVGTPPLRSIADMSAAFLPSPALALIQKGEISAEEAETWAMSCTCLGPQYPQWLKSDFERTDPAARIGLINSLGSGAFKNEWEQISVAKIPVTLVFGAEDRFVNKSFLVGPLLQNLWGKRIETLSTAGHMAHWDSDRAFNDIIADRIQNLGI
jgi:pimeloyl-ACP methyl ester carboxylesterase